MCNNCGNEFTRRDSMIRHSRRCQAVKSQIYHVKGNAPARKWANNNANMIVMFQSMINRPFRELKSANNDNLLNHPFEKLQKDLQKVKSTLNQFENKLSELEHRGKDDDHIRSN